MDNWFFKSAVQIARGIREGNVSALSVMRAHLDRIETVNPPINAIVQYCAETALHEAQKADRDLGQGKLRGPLHGVPFTLKDSFKTKNFISSAGTPGRQNYIPQFDAIVAERLKSAGAILIGKTNTSELTLLADCETSNPLYGKTNNPYDITRTPSGSSGGSAAAVAAGMSAFDIGSDTGGSIREPCHFCGVTGLKPTRGRVPRTGHIIGSGDGILDRLTQIGPIARYVCDLELTLNVLTKAGNCELDTVAIPLGASAQVQTGKLKFAVSPCLSEGKHRSKINGKHPVFTAAAGP